MPRTTYLPSGSVFPWGVSLLSDLLETEISSNAITTVSNEIYSMSGMITSDPTHTGEERQNLLGFRGAVRSFGQELPSVGNTKPTNTSKL